MLIINQEVLDQSIQLKDIVEAVEQAFVMQEAGGYTMPERLHLGYGEDVFLLMPCLKDDVFATKLITIYPHNAEKGKPVTMGNVLLNDAATGEALALLNGTYLTAMRTGAVGAVSAKYLSPADSHVCGLIGAGTQGLFQVLALATVRDLTDVYVYDALPGMAERFAARLQAKLPGLRCHLAQSTEELVTQAQIILCATTSTTPVLPDDPGLYAGKHIVGIGSYQPHVREFSDGALAAALADSGCVFIDTPHALEETGDLIIPLAEGRLAETQICHFSKLLQQGGDPALRTQTTLFKSVGIALFDLCAAEVAYRKAREAGVGLTVDM